MIRRDRDADAGADLDAVAGQKERLGDELGDPRREFGRAVALIVASFLDDGEFVAAEPRQHVAGAQRISAAARDLAQQRIAGSVTERVVDVLEAVEIEHQDRERRRGPASNALSSSSRARKKARFGSPVRMSVWASSSTRRFASDSRCELRLASMR